MDRRILETMFYKGIMPREMCCPNRKEYNQTAQLCETVESDLENHLTPELKRMFEDYKGYIQQLTTMENAEHFVQGMSLGIQITAEAFITGKSKTE